MIRDIAFDDLTALAQLAEEGFGAWSEPLTLTQAMIDEFATLSGDHQWIHVDVERARRESPFGATIAHGFLLLSLLSRFQPRNSWRITGYSLAVNYGAKGLRFLAPVPAGAAIHERLRIAGAEAHAKGTLVTMEMAVHRVGFEKPALLYAALILYQGPPK